MFQRAWITDPYDGGEIWMGFMMGDEKILNVIEHELKEVGHLLEPDGTMINMQVIIDQNPELKHKYEEKMKAIIQDHESKGAMFV